MSSREGRRLDTALVAGGFVTGREKAKELIAGGHVLVNGRPATKGSMIVTDADILDCDASAVRYVGRGGYKLERAIEAGGLSLAGLTAMDVGASTGGFTDCMLQHGAAKVYAVDVGHDQLHPALRADPRVCSLEGIDIRKTENICRYIAESSVLFCSIDVSFISVRGIFSSIRPFLHPDATVVCLIKPQFEAGRQAVGKNGIVKDPAAHRQVLRELCAFFAGEGYGVRLLTHSPIRGGEGNIEYLAVLRRPAPGEPGAVWDVNAVVKRAHEALRCGGG